MTVAKIDATGGAFTSADFDERWKSHAAKIKDLRLDSARPSVQCESGVYRFECWIDESLAKGPWYMAVHEVNGLLVGYFSFSRRGDVLFAHEVAVRRSYRRMGIASTMYNLGEKITRLRFVPCTPHSPYAAAFWANRPTLTG